MQYIRAWEIEDRRRRREIADLESMRVKYQKDAETEESQLEGQREQLLRSQAKRKRYEGTLENAGHRCIDEFDGVRHNRSHVHKRIVSAVLDGICFSQRSLADTCEHLNSATLCPNAKMPPHYPVF
ncbi:unnamed protein product [Effrenium voratum]|nr:unnamed protein product [Effrenium voratum]